MRMATRNQLGATYTGTPKGRPISSPPRLRSSGRWGAVPCRCRSGRTGGRGARGARRGCGRGGRGFRVRRGAVVVLAGRGGLAVGGDTVVRAGAGVLGRPALGALGPGVLRVGGRRGGGGRGSVAGAAGGLGLGPGVLGRLVVAGLRLSAPAAYVHRCPLVRCVSRACRTGGSWVDGMRRPPPLPPRTPVSTPSFPFLPTLPLSHSPPWCPGGCPQGHRDVGGGP